ncbi:MAG: hypothetical protein ACUVUG_09015 [Candidatus Aminicenantia bacterium]
MEEAEGKDLVYLLLTKDRLNLKKELDRVEERKQTVKVRVDL